MCLGKICEYEMDLEEMSKLGFIEDIGECITTKFSTRSVILVTDDHVTSYSNVTRLLGQVITKGDEFSIHVAVESYGSIIGGYSSPWYSIPLSDSRREKLVKYLNRLPKTKSVTTLDVSMSGITTLLSKTYLVSKTSLGYGMVGLYG